MVVFGAGHVAHALVPLLQTLDFDLTVVDDRDELLTAERFPGVRRELRPCDEVADELADDPRAAWLIVTHDHALDQRLVEALLPKQCAWLGMIGSKAKVARFLVRLRAAGVDEALFRKLCAPVGLDLGAETPAEIAVSIAAELVRVRRGCNRVPRPLSEVPLAARGGDGTALAPALSHDD
jgi:xanthine dehydrogenase accessory factor